MKIKGILIIVISIFLILGLFCYCDAETIQNNILVFKCDGAEYSVDVKQIAEEQGIDIREYPYYVIEKTLGNNPIYIYYSKERIRPTDRNSDGSYNCSLERNTLEIRIMIDGTIYAQKLNSTVKRINRFMFSNHNIYYNGMIMLRKNHGYEYDKTQETQETVNEIVKTNKDTIVYEKPSVIYDNISTLKEGNVVKRIKKVVNDRDGHVWDKIVISDGREGYIYTDSLEIMNSYTNVEFTYKDKEYNVYVPKNNYAIDMDQIPYYMIGKLSENGEIKIYYSSQKIQIKSRAADGESTCSGGTNAIEVTIKEDGSTSIRKINLGSYSVSIRIFIASNHNIYYDRDIIFNKNNGYEYDSNQETQETVNEIVKTNKDTIVYEKPSIIYDNISTLKEGNVVKRIKKAVNDKDGQVWDKVVISDGREGYVYTDSLELMDGYTNVEFTYKDKEYNVYVPKNNYAIDMDQIPYYMIGKLSENSEIKIYYSSQKIQIKSRAADGESTCSGGTNAIEVTIKADGSTSIRKINLGSYSVSIRIFIASNHNIYYDRDIIFNKNNGYEYDSNQETQETVNEIVKTNKDTIVYEKPSIIYDSISTLPEGNVVKRIKKAVNDKDGQVWDKVVISDGREGYVYTDSLELMDSYTNIEFTYEDKEYNVYVPKNNYGIDMDKVPYYMIGRLSANSDIKIYYSNEKIQIESKDESGEHRCSGGAYAIEVTIKADGSTSIRKINLVSDSASIRIFIASNHDIYYDREIIFSANIYSSNDKLNFATNMTMDDIECDRGAYSAIVQGEKDYASMSAAEIFSYYKVLSEEKAALHVTVTAAANWCPNGAAAFLYFLSRGEECKTDNTYSYTEEPYTEGHTMREINALAAINNNSYVKKKLDNNINTVLEVAEKLCTEEDSYIRFNNTIEDSGTASGIFGESSWEECDWFVAMNNYRIRMQCIAIKHGEQYELQLQYRIIDYYDWLTADEDYYEAFSSALGVASKNFEQLHRAGLARNYTNYGYTYYTILWNKGERIGTGATYSN